MKRSLSLYPVVLWVLIACLFQIRPLIPLSRGTPILVWIWVILFALSILETTLLLRMRIPAAKFGVAICAAWVFWILARIAVAIQYGPDVIAPGVTQRSLLEGAVIVAANLFVLRYLTRKKFLADCVRYRMEQNENFRWNRFMEEMKKKGSRKSD